MAEKPLWDWCLGKRVPVEIAIYRKNAERSRQVSSATATVTLPYRPAGLSIVEGTVAALNPRKKKGAWQQPKGLFLDGAVWHGHPEVFPEVLKVVTKKDGKDVTKHIKMSFGPGL